MKIKVVKSENLASALTWLGFKSEKEGNEWIFKRSCDFDIAWKNIHCLRNSLREYKEMRE